MSATIIVACDPNGLIGVSGHVPWDCPQERIHFREMTLGKVVVMGRKTWESLPLGHRPLRDRTLNVVLTHNSQYQIPLSLSDQDRWPTIICPNLDIVLQSWPDCWIIGGADVYEQALRDPRVTRCVVSRMRKSYEIRTLIPQNCGASYLRIDLLQREHGWRGWGEALFAESKEEFAVYEHDRIPPC